MELDLAKIKKVFFVGIGGIGISAVARMMLLEGKTVGGSDIAETEIMAELRRLGADVSIGQNFDLIPKDADLIVYTIAIGYYDAKLLEAILASGITARSYPQMLTTVTKGKYTIAVSGTHGKTTTTAMIAKVLVDTKRDPSVIVGSLLKESNSNLIVGKSQYFVVEACEYERSFLNIHPSILVITNIEPDHLDYYKDLADIESAFGELASQTKNFVVCNPNESATAESLKGKNMQVVDYTKYLDLVPELSVPGKHNRANAACAFAVAELLNIPEVDANKALVSFVGTWRRLEKRGALPSGAIIYDDYAHHPTEIRASLQALRELYPKGQKRITILFQPHLYSRTKALWNEFVTAFDEADTVTFLPIYFARETPDPEITSEKLAQEISLHKSGTISFSDFETAEQFARNSHFAKDDIFVTMGAGVAYKIGDDLMKD